MHPSLPPAVLTFPHIDPFLFRIGPVGLSWYAFMYLVGFTAGYFILRYRFRHGTLTKFHALDEVGLLITYCFYGIILGGRLGYILFYNFSYYLNHPAEIPAIWHGGMAFHGAVMGGALGMLLFARRQKIPALYVFDAVALCVPIGLFFGRIGNFINGELYGRVTDVAWAMVFPRGGPLPRHPSQLYESFLEGVVLGLLLYLVYRKKMRDGSIFACSVLFYGCLRFFIEFFREPDAQLGFILGPLSMGQLLCIAMVIAGGTMLAWIYRSPSQDHRNV